MRTRHFLAGTDLILPGALSLQAEPLTRMFPPS